MKSDFTEKAKAITEGGLNDIVERRAILVYSNIDKYCRGKF